MIIVGQITDEFLLNYVREHRKPKKHGEGFEEILAEEMKKLDAADQSKTSNNLE